MTRSNWIAGALLVLAVLGLGLTFDPLGWWADPQDDPRTEESDDGALLGAGLRGRGRNALPEEDPAHWEGDPVGVLTLSLGTSSLQGAVTGEGRPLRFARVQPVLAPPHDGLAVRTTREGRWEVRGLPAGQFDVRATHPEHVGRTVVSPAVLEGGVGEVETIDLERRQARRDGLVVRVTDVLGRPIQGARVLATTMPWDLHLAMGPDMTGTRDVRHASGITDEKGRVRLAPLAPEDYNVVTYAKGYANQGVNDVVVAGGSERHLTLRLAESVAIRGRVVDREGRGVPDAIVMGMAQPSFVSSLTTRSEADGSFVLDGLRSGPYMVIGWEETGGQVMTTGTAPGSGVTLTLEGTGLAEGVVTWEDGTPVTAGQVRPFQTGPFQYVYSMVEPLTADGRFSLRLPKGLYTFLVQAESGHVADGTTATINVGETTPVAIRMPQTGVVRGVVMDADGRHVEGAEVYVMKGGFPESPSREQYARSDEDGAFEVPGLALEAVKLHVVHPEFAEARVDARPAPAGKASAISVRLDRGARVVGAVRESDGRPVEGEQVNLVRTWFDARTAFTDASGRYVFEAVAPGTYSMTTGPFEQGARGLSKGGVAVFGSGDVVVDFTNPALGGRLTGEVRVGESPVPDAEVRIQDTRGPDQAVVVRTDATGRFLAEGLQVGQATLIASTPSGLSGTTRADVDAGDVPRHAVVEIGTARVRVRVLDAEGNPVPGCWCNTELAHAPDAGWSRVKDNGNTDSQGVYEARGLQAATYLVRINRVEFAQYVGEPFALAADETRDLGDVRLTRGALLSGQVRDDAGAPVEKATVSLRDAQGRPVFLFSMATSGSDGRYALHGVEAGRYTVTFEARGHAPDERPVDIGPEGAHADGTLTRGGALAVLVEDETGRPLLGVAIRLFDARGQLVTRTISMVNFDSGRRTTDSTGRTSLEDLAGGSYLVQPTLEGHAPMGSETRAYIRPGETTEVRIVLQAGS